MKIGIILPHFKAFGGVRRFLSVGRELESRGHQVRFWAKSPAMPDWFDPGWRPTLAQSGFIPDLLLIGDPPSFKRLKEFPIIWIYVWVIAGGEYLKTYKALYDRHDRHVRFLINNRIFATQFPLARWIEGGVDTKRFCPRVRRVGYYAGRGDTKGEGEIVKQLSGLKSVKLIPLQGLTQSQLVDAYRSLDYFVTWEQRAGWSNTAAEALASGVPVVTNGVNCEPFVDRCIVVKELRGFFEAPMVPFDWTNVVNRLEEIWREDCVRG